MCMWTGPSYWMVRPGLDYTDTGLDCALHQTCRPILLIKPPCTVLYLYCDERMDIQWNLAWAQGKSRGKAWGISQGLRLYFIVFPDSSHNSGILNFKSSIDLPGRSILEELIFRIAWTWKILPSRLSNTGEFNFYIIMFSNWECLDYPAPQARPGLTEPPRSSSPTVSAWAPCPPSAATTSSTTTASGTHCKNILYTVRCTHYRAFMKSHFIHFCFFF